jgi:hypothetical protein
LYGTTTSPGKATALQAVGSGTAPVLVSANLSGLTPGVTYYFEAVAKSTAGSGSGAILNFTTITTPEIITPPATVTGTSTATLHALVNPNGASTTVFFQYGTSTTYTGRAPALPSSGIKIGHGTALVPVSVQITGLDPATTYHFIAEAFGAGFVLGSDATFQTAFPYKIFAGNYSAVYLGSTSTTSGLVNLSVTPAGTYTASIKSTGKTYHFGGKIDGKGEMSGTSNGVELLAELQGAAGSQVVEGLIGGMTSGTFQALPPYTGTLPGWYFTFGIQKPSDPSLPQGYGYGSIKMNKTGGVNLSGTLGDGTPFSTTGQVGESGIFPLYVSEYGGQGEVVGNLIFSIPSVTSTLEWFKPPTTGTYTTEPVAVQTLLQGEIWKAPGKNAAALSDTSGLLSFFDGNLITSPLSVSADLTKANKIVPATPPFPDSIAISFNPGTGMFSGSFKDPTTSALRKFGGAVLLFSGTDGIGYGNFKGTTEAGGVELFAP